MAEDRGFEPLRDLSQHDFQFDSPPFVGVRTGRNREAAARRGLGWIDANGGELRPKVRPGIWIRTDGSDRW